MFVLYGVLAAASISVGLLTSRGSPLRKQVNAWWLLFPVVSVSLFLYPVGLVLLTLLIAVLAERELVLHHTATRWKFRLFCAAFLLLQAAFALYGMVTAIEWLPSLVALQALHFWFRRQADQLLMLLFLLLCCGLSFVQRVLYLPLQPEVQLSWLFYLFVVTALNDIAQFISGKCFGKHRIAVRLSPNKTWQGLLGGVVISMLVSVLLGRYLQLAQTRQLLTLALLLALGGFMGDLLFSAAKRYLGIKDFSQLIPGHGGILDRVDSLVFTAPLLYFGLTLTQ